MGLIRVPIFSDCHIVLDFRKIVKVLFRGNGILGIEAVNLGVA